MPALQIIALDTTTPQLRAPSAADTYAAPRAVEITPVSLTGSSATSSLAITQTWNTTGTPTALQLNVTDIASNAASLLMDLRVGGTSKFSVLKSTTTSTTIRLSSNGGNADITAQGNGLDIGAASNNHNVVLPGATFQRLGAGYGIQIGTGLSTSAPLLYGGAQEANHTLAQRNGVNAQAFNIYNTFTDASNYERGFARWSTNIFQIGTAAAGTGTTRGIQIIAGTTTYGFQANEVAIFPQAGGIEFSGRLRLSSPALGIFRLTEHNGANAGALELREWASAPAAPATDNVRIYAEDNGSGKTRLMARFATGAAVQIAIEP